MDLPGELWDACWGLQGVTSLAGEISALGLVLKQAEVAGAVGPSLLSGNQVGQASVLCPRPGLPTCGFPWTPPWRSPCGDHPFSNTCGLCWAKPCTNTMVPAPDISSTAASQPRAVDLLSCGCCGSLGSCPSREEALARRRGWEPHGLTSSMVAVRTVLGLL